MAQGIILDPTASRAADNADPGPDAGALVGKRVGFRVDQIWRAWDQISELWADKLRKSGVEVSFWRSCGRSGEEGERMARELEEWLGTIDVAIIGLANCGSCTGWTIRDAISAANSGIPTLAIATKNFEDFAHVIAARGARSGLRVHVLPYPLNERAPEEVETVGHDHFHPMLESLGARVAAARDAA